MSYLVSTSIRKFRVVFGALLLLVSSIGLTFDAEVVSSDTDIQFSSTSEGLKYFSVNVWGPDSTVVFSQTSNGSSVTWSLESGATDGRYKYEIKMSSVAPGSRSRSTTNASADNEVMVSTVSGSVLVQSGSIVPASSPEIGARLPLIDHIADFVTLVLETLVPSARADVTHQDDTIIFGSLCVGVDCSTNENFDLDSIRITENNLRIHFEDTSLTASFPTNDWRIVINDTTNGGANFFAVEDASAGQKLFTLEAGAPANALYVDKDGRIGLGTSNPVANLEAVAGSTPTFRLSQDGSLGYSSQAWDLGGNESGFFLRDATNGSQLPLQIQPGATTNSLYVNAAGNVGVGLDNPTEKLHVMGNAIISGNLELGSSRAIKNQIQDLGLEQALAALLNLEPVLFKYNHSPEDQSIGFIAEDVPDLVATENRTSLKPMDIVAVLTKVVQAQQETIEELSTKIDRLSTKDNDN